MNKEPQKDKKIKDSETIRAISYFSQIGFTIAATVIVGVLLGKYLDSLLGTSPWLLLIFSLLGLGAAMKAMFNVSYDNKNNKDENEEKE